jgi:hypothetical protein
MNELGKLLVVGGIVMALIGALLWSGIGRGWIGRMPGFTITAAMLVFTFQS